MMSIIFGVEMVIPLLCFVISCAFPKAMWRLGVFLREFSPDKTGFFISLVPVVFVAVVFTKLNEFTKPQGVAQIILKWPGFVWLRLVYFVSLGVVILSLIASVLGAYFLNGCRMRLGATLLLSAYAVAVFVSFTILYGASQLHRLVITDGEDQ